ncbi:hypothetical protein VNI00_019136 [Paramarasmius palmivorus]|uniref:Uncharacterized protein n=1 Tax=Paramarasmius palmivorus TaxID=297713 RepID=A0AAW0ARH6_9AGAR
MGRYERYGCYSLMRRVRQIEGLWGMLLKGLVPRILEWILITVPIILYAHLATHLGPYDITKPQLVLYITCPDYRVQDTVLLFIISILVGLPFHVLVVRATTTKYVLSYCRPTLSLKLLLSPTERRHPWTLYTIPGLFLGFILQIAVPLGLTNLSGRLMYPHLGMKSNSAMDILLAQLAVTIGAKLLCVPLYVANTRLAMVGQCPTRYVGGELEQASRRHWDVQEAEESGVPMYCREEEDPVVY